MNPSRILILGGYGNTGRLVAELLLKWTDVRVIIAGRALHKAESLADELNGRFRGERVRAMCLDASDSASMAPAFTGATIVLVASSTSEFTLNVAHAALEAGTDYFDIQLSSSGSAVLKSLSDKILSNGRCFISDGGFHPGVPAALVRYVAAEFDRLERANVGSLIRIDWKTREFSDCTMEEFAMDMSEFAPLCFVEREWRKSWKNSRTFDFGEVFGKQVGIAMSLDEMKSLPEMYPSLRETGFFVGGFNWFVDTLLMVPGLFALRIFGRGAARPVGKSLLWGLRTFSAPPYGTILLIDAAGWKGDRWITRRVKVEHEDGYMLTAVPIVACLLQYLDGSIKKPGIWLQANVVEPIRFFRDVARLGVSVEILDTGVSGKEHARV